MTEILNRWLDSGRDRASDHSLRRKVFQTNFGALLGVLTVVLFTVLFLLTGNAALGRTAWVMPIFLPFFALVPWLNHRGHPLAASWAFCLTKTLTVVGVLVSGEGTLLDAYFYFLVFAFAPIAFFPVKKLGPIVFLFSLNLALFLFFKYLGFAPAPEMLVLDGGTVTVLQIVHILLAVIALLVFMFLSESAAETNERKFEALAMLDPLTDLQNRRSFQVQLVKCQARLYRSGGFGAVLFIDLDRFKSLNDEHGHQAGDQLLVQTAGRLVQAVRQADLVARYGGDEFVILVDFPGADRADARDGAVTLATKLQADLSRPYHLQTGMIPVEFQCTASLGVVLFEGSSDPGLVLQEADRAMYRAKEAGRNRLEILEGLSVGV